MKDIVRKIIYAAHLAPTADNSQPFLFEWQRRSQQLLIRVNPSRQKHLLNISNHSLFLSLGFIFESIEIAALKEGLKPSFKFQPDFDLQSNIIAEIHFIDTTPLEHPLFNSLFTRCTDRNHFKKTLHCLLIN